MKILHIVAGSLKNGAAKGALSLHEGLSSIGVNSFVLNNHEYKLKTNNVIRLAETKFQRKIYSFKTKLSNIPTLLYINRNNIIFNTGFDGIDVTKLKIYKESDVIHLHGINGLLNIFSLKKIQKPVLWTVRDIWPVSGGCHLGPSFNCFNFRSGCGNCPQLQSKTSYDISRLNFLLKKKNIPDQLVVVGISEWMTRCIKESDIFNGKKVLTINNAVDTNEFYPEKKELVRNKYKIPLYSKVVLTGSLNNSDYHKGFDLLIEAINEVDIKDLLLVIFGPTKNYLISKITKQVLNLGEIEGNNTLREIYSCADVYVSPSRMESFGKTITEAMACGIPSICFDSIGAVDLIRNQRNGFIAKSFDTKSLKKCIEEIFNLTEKELIKYKKNALNSVVNTIDNHTIAMKYKKLYEEIT